MLNMVEEYGAPLVFYHAAAWAAMWFGLYSLQDTLRPVLGYFCWDASVEKVDPSMGNVVISYFVNEGIEYGRIFII